MGSWYAYNEILIQQALVLIVLGYSLQFTLRVGAFSMAGVAWWGVGAYGAGRLMLEGHGFALSLLLVVALSVVLSGILGLMLARLRSLYLSMATFAVVYLTSTVALRWGDITNGAAGMYGVPLGLTTLDAAIIAAVVTLVMALHEHGRVGRSIELMRIDESLARSLGINVAAGRLYAFIVQGALGAISGAMYISLYSSVTPPDIGFDLLMDALVLVIMGGAYRWPGVLIGAVIVTWLPEALRFADDWRAVINGVIIVLTVLFARNGIYGLISDGVRRGRAALRATRSGTKGLQA